MIIIEVSTKKSFKPIRDVDVEYDIDNSKCVICKDKPCLKACPVGATYIDPDDNLTKINANCFGCVLCRESCPFDAIYMKTKLSKPIKQNIPNINSKLCKACGACVAHCKTGAIHLTSSGSEEVHSEIDEDKCVGCGYCFRSCPTDAIKYGEILPRTVSGGRAIVVNQDNCIGCMSCTKVCPSKGAINVSKTNKLPYIDPSYCARCEECMDICPATAIKYSSRKRAFASFNKIKSLEITSCIINKDIKKISEDISKIDTILTELANDLALNEGNEFEMEVTPLIIGAIESTFDSDFDVVEIKNIVDYFPPIRKIRVLEDECIGCGACIDPCPVSAIWLELPTPIHIENNCVFCGKCVEVCPTSSIILTEEFFQARGEDIFFIRRHIIEMRDGKFNIDKDLCQSCGVCTNQCPVNALQLENDEIFVNQDICISCRECEALCPVNAIKISLNK